MLGRLFFALLLVVSSGCIQQTAGSDALERWDLWEAYAAKFVSEDGRVIDHTGGGHSTSEGQAYGMFFALVAGDRARFELMLQWTAENLAGGELTRELPAWKWGLDEAGAWRVLDGNSASDADLWLAYTLLQAGRLWCEPSFEELGRRIALMVEERSVSELPGLGPMLLPAPIGFRLGEGMWRLNPSYLPIFQLRALADELPDGPWDAVLTSTVELLMKGTQNGFVADWVAYAEERGFHDDPVSGNLGSYDAIRGYLWAGLLSDDDPHKATASVRLSGLYDVWAADGRVPERIVDFAPAEGTRSGPPGFYAVLLPTAVQMENQAGVRRLRRHLAARRSAGLYGDPPAYYDQNLIMFAEGHVDAWYRFMPDGRLEPRWVATCMSQ